MDTYISQNVTKSFIVKSTSHYDYAGYIIKNGYFEYQFGQPVTETRLTSPDKRKSFYEDVVQLGTMDNTRIGTVNGEQLHTQ